MTTLKILRGVPGSGKSTHAAELRAAGMTVVNRDEIRFSLFGAYWGASVDEEVVTKVENAAIEGALAAGRDTVVDATNLRNKNLNAKLSFASRYGATVEFVDFPVPLETAITRDAGRERNVGARVIKGFFQRYKINPETGALKAPPTPLPEFKRYTPNTDMPAAYIVDTDGTVANMNPHRGPYDHNKYHLDTRHEHVADVVEALAFGGWSVIALSGRDEKYREVTENWWEQNGLDFSAFFMRPQDDTRMDAIIKYELFTEHIAPNWNVLGAFDDRPQVIRMWETIGVPVFNVGTEGEF